MKHKFLLLTLIVLIFCFVLLAQRTIDSENRSIIAVIDCEIVELDIEYDSHYVAQKLREHLIKKGFNSPGRNEIFKKLNFETIPIDGVEKNANYLLRYLSSKNIVKIAELLNVNRLIVISVLKPNKNYVITFEFYHKSFGMFTNPKNFTRKKLNEKEIKNIIQSIMLNHSSFFYTS